MHRISEATLLELTSCRPSLCSRACRTDFTFSSLTAPATNDHTYATQTAASDLASAAVMSFALLGAGIVFFLTEALLLLRSHA